VANPSRGWAAGACRLVAWVIANRPDQGQSVLSRAFRVPGTAEAYLETMRTVQARKDALALAPHFRPEASPADILSRLGSEWREGAFADGNSAIAPLVARAIPGLDWSPFIAAINGHLMELGATAEPTARTGIAILLELGTANDQAREALKQLVDDGYLAHWCHSLHENVTAVATILFAVLRDDPPLQRQTGAGNANAGAQLLKEILAGERLQDEAVSEFAELVRRHRALDMMLVACEQVPAHKPFISRVVSLLSEDQQWSAIFTAGAIYSHDHTLYVCLGRARYDQLIEDSVRSDGLRRHLMQAFDVDSCDLYEEALSVVDGPDEAAFGGFIAAGLATLSAAEWKSSLEDDNNAVVGLALAAHQKGIPLRMGTDLYDGIVSYVESVLGGETPSESTVAAFPAILLTLPPGHRHDVIEAMAARFVACTRPLGPALDLFGEVLLSEPDALTDHAWDLLDNSFRQILDSRDESQIAWMGSVLAERPRLLEAVPPQARTRLRDRLVRARENGLSEASLAAIDSILGSLGGEEHRGGAAAGAVVETSEVE
jgi:hypothetical protein